MDMRLPPNSQPAKTKGPSERPSLACNVQVVVHYAALLALLLTVQRMSDCCTAGCLWLYSEFWAVQLPVTSYIPALLSVVAVCLLQDAACKATAALCGGLWFAIFVCMDVDQRAPVQGGSHTQRHVLLLLGCAPAERFELGPS